VPALHAPTGIVAGRFPAANPPAATPEDQHDEYHACQRGNRRQPCKDERELQNGITAG
jgi:hypothetical protein